jgi:hypothetical protein
MYIYVHMDLHTQAHTHIDTVKACDTTNEGVERRAGTARIACVSIRQHTSAYVSIRQHTTNKGVERRAGTARIACVSIRQLTSAYVSLRQHTTNQGVGRQAGTARIARLTPARARCV